MKLLHKLQPAKARSPKLLTRLFALFFVAISLVSLTNLFVFSRMLNAMEDEADVLNNERLNSALLKLDGILSEVQNCYASLIQADSFQSYAGIEPSPYAFFQMQMSATLFDSCPYIQTWAVLLEGTEISVNYIGVNSDLAFFTQYCSTDAREPGFWRELFDARFSRMYFPASEYRVVNRTAQANSLNLTLLPVVMKSYWKNNILVVMFLNPEIIEAEIGPYMAEGTYLFSEDGQLLYTSDPVRQIDSVPPEDRLRLDSGAVSVYRATGEKSGLQYVKLIPESQTAELVRSSQRLFLTVTLLSLSSASVLMLLSVRRTLHPINSMLDLLRQHTELEDTDNITEARSALEGVLQQREEQAKSLAKQDALLSEYVFRAQLKSVYVGAPQNRDPETGNVYLLYIQLRYRENAAQRIKISRAELEKLLQEVLSAELNRHFASALMFQLEPGCFAAKVTSGRETDISGSMALFLRRLEQEGEFAYFTVVQSRKLRSGEDLAEAYTEVLQGARQARVCEQTQWISMEAAPTETDILFSKQEEQRLSAAIHARMPEAAAEQASEILTANLRQRISYEQLEILCVALVNTVTYAMSEQLPNGERLTAVSSVYNRLATQCRTAGDYCGTVLRFIRSCMDGGTEAGDKDILLRKIRQYLHENYRREFTGEEMAEALKVSRSYLSTYYKNKTGANLSDSIQLYRIQKAMELMKDPDIMISEVGAMVGIYSGNTFLRQFKKYTGMSPKEFRSKCREQSEDTQ